MVRKTDWPFHLFFWLLLIALSWNFSSRLYSWEQAAIMSIGNVSVLVAATYFYLRVILPALFRRGRFGWYLLAFIGLVAASGLSTVVLLKFLAYYLELSPAIPQWGQSPVGRPPFAPPFFSTITVLFTATIYDQAKQQAANERRRMQLEKDKIRHELNFLRSQINPHFLFNALNNIHATVQLRPEQAGDYILTLGEMLRYVLEDCQHEKVNLQAEVRYIRNYIYLQQQKDDQLQNLTFEITGESSKHFHIEPMLLITLIENAFQHSQVSDDGARWVGIELHLNPDTFLFRVCNNVGNQKQEHLGLGIQNLKRRLKLLYPNRHTFKYGAQNGIFCAELKLELLSHASELPNP